MGLKSPEVRAKAVMSLGAVTVTRRSSLRGVSTVSARMPPYSGASWGSWSL